VPDQGKAKWLAEHGAPDSRAEVTIVADIEDWEAAGLSVKDDGQLEGGNSYHLGEVVKRLCKQAWETTGSIPDEIDGADVIVGMTRMAEDQVDEYIAEVQEKGVSEGDRSDTGTVETTEGEPEVKLSHLRYFARCRYSIGPLSIDDVRQHPRVLEELADLMAEADRRTEEARQEAVDRLPTVQAERRAEAERKVEAERVAKAERATWIDEHGSTRLRRLVAEEIVHAAVYRDERLALERPAWTWYNNTYGTDEEPRNAPMEALEMLDKAREVDEEAELRYWRPTEDDIDSDQEIYSMDDLPDWRGYVATAGFLGREIVFGLPEECIRRK